ncbi:hypothetical protein ACE7GA_01860 [Roseomonas sp. CCTCC AB2023176]|uniref:hypothetical protein n=1 Tax=Roseomonas sp. CCTCC AB2023176 TaxID=3342640 RepID=UPI0035DFCE8B
MKALLATAVIVATATAALAQPYDRSRPAGNNLDGRYQIGSGRSPGAPLDRGPYTSDANRAYMGGGMVMEGAPGASAPMPQAMPNAGMESSGMGAPGMGSSYGSTMR